MNEVVTNNKKTKIAGVSVNDVERSVSVSIKTALMDIESYQEMTTGHVRRIFLLSVQLRQKN